MSAALSVTGLTVRYGGVVAVDDLSFDLAAGESIAVVGPNGSGKTTVLDCLCGLRRPDRGTVRLGGRDLVGLAPHAVAREGVARTFQAPQLAPARTVHENVLAGRFRLEADDRAGRVDQILDALGLRPWLDVAVGSLPVGARRRIELARAVVAEPSLLLLDEPFSGMDAADRSVVRDVLMSLRREGVGLIVVEHHRALAETFTDQTLALGPGGRKRPPTPPSRAGASGAARDSSAEPADPAERRLRIRRPSPDGLHPSTAPPRPPLLTFSDWTVGSGRLTRLDGVDVAIEEGRITALVGRDGAGKTTLLRAVLALDGAPSAGSVAWQGAPLRPHTPERVARLGVAWVPEGRRVFAELTVRENLRAGALSVRDPREVKERITEVERRFPVLAERARQRAGTLSGGEQQMLALGRASVARPRLLLVDEPSVGLAPEVADAVFQWLAELRDGGTTVLLAAQDVDRALAIADRVVLMEAGRVARVGTVDELGGDPRVTALRSVRPSETLDPAPRR